jgi:glycyl-tRNA synthetase (class II)
MVAMLEFYDEEILTKENSDGTTTEDTRIVVRFPFALAPVKFAVLPLLEKSDEMVAKARSLQKILRQAGYTCEYDGSGGIGKRYRRQDEIGTPYCVTIDHQTLEDGTVTVRDRDTMEQLGEDGRMTLEELIMLEINILGDDCGDDCDCGDCGDCDCDDDQTTHAHKHPANQCCGGHCGC